ncbi:MAG: hypothetical protein HYT90_02445 [Candidatus Omnitrophica bacterium]|nr:hypothetical protein [Candidatus Omnitrophota bacterium]
MGEQASAVTGTPAAAVPKPFQFRTALVLQESTGLRASTLVTLAKLLRKVPDSCVYYHTHHFVLEHHYLTPEPTNDFAYWVGEIFGDETLGELLASVDIMEYTALQGLREVLAGTIERYIKEHPATRIKFAPSGREFFFIKSVHVIMPTPYTVSTLAEFAQALEQVSLHSLYFHIFDARLRLGRPTNDFSLWLTEQLGLKALGESVAGLNPYAHTLQTLRTILLSLIREAAAHA